MLKAAKLLSQRRLRLTLAIWRRQLSEARHSNGWQRRRIAEIVGNQFAGVVFTF